MTVRASHHLQTDGYLLLGIQCFSPLAGLDLQTLDILLGTLLDSCKGSRSVWELEFRGDRFVLDQQLYQRLEMAMALLQPQQQQQQQQRDWFFIDFEDDGGIYEVEVDMVGLCI